MIADIALSAFIFLFVTSAGVTAYLWVMSRRGPSVPTSGADAYREGFDVSDNPYPPDDDRHDVWFQEWDADRHFIERRP